VERCGCHTKGVNSEEGFGVRKKILEECTPVFEECFIDLVACEFWRGGDSNGLSRVPKEG